MKNLLGRGPLAVRIDRVPVLLQNLQRSIVIDMNRLRRMGEHILAAMHVEDAELSIVLVSDGRIRDLNRRYRKKDSATDVLAFPLESEGGGPSRLRRTVRVRSLRKAQAQPPWVLGDVVISLATARRQAQDFGHGLNQEVVRLLVHGVLHLLGYDHERGRREAARMADEERRVLGMVGAT
ncbi:MAG TPA: rRNA maturation RNase YbeY [Nitrospirales bacterium]|jgi:probable rRNA maturation factor